MFKEECYMKSAYVFLAEGFEDVEAVTPIDYLRRAGLRVVVVGVTGKTVKSGHDLNVQTDATVDELEALPLPDLAVLPGGGLGSKNLSESGGVRRIIEAMMAEGRPVGAICAAPAVVLGGWNLLNGRRWTCYPGSGDSMDPEPLEERVVIDGNLVTSRAAGSAEEFSLALISVVIGESIANKLRMGLLAR